jgi:hypothetical protein
VYVSTSTDLAERKSDYEKREKYRIGRLAARALRHAGKAGSEHQPEIETG